MNAAHKEWASISTSATEIRAMLALAHTRLFLLIMSSSTFQVGVERGVAGKNGSFPAFLWLPNDLQRCHENQRNIHAHL